MAPPDLPGKIALFVFSILWFSFTAMFWGSFLFSAMQFSDTYFDFWNWRGKRYRIEYTGVISLISRIRKQSTWELRVCYFALGFSEKTSWLNLNSALGWRNAIIEGVRIEIPKRAHLILLGEIDEERGIEGDVTWVKSGLKDMALFDHRGNVAINRYSVEWIVDYGLLLLGLAFLLGGLFVFANGYYHWGKNQPGVEISAGWICFVGSALIVLWIGQCIAGRKSQVRAVEWDDHELILYIKYGSPVRLSWSDITHATVPKKPPLGSMRIFVPAKEKPYIIPFTDNEKCLVFLDVLKSKVQVDTED
jgi:hypothetical protein